LDWIQAAVWSNDIPEVFFTRDVDYQNAIIAAYLITKYEEAVVAKEQADEARRNSGA
jgi:hypothetical protein